MFYIWTGLFRLQSAIQLLRQIIKLVLANNEEECYASISSEKSSLGWIEIATFALLALRSNGLS